MPPATKLPLPGTVSMKPLGLEVGVGALGGDDADASGRSPRHADRGKLGAPRRASPVQDEVLHLRGDLLVDGLAARVRDDDVHAAPAPAPAPASFRRLPRGARASRRPAALGWRVAASRFAPGVGGHVPRFLPWSRRARFPLPPPGLRSARRTLKGSASFVYIPDMHTIISCGEAVKRNFFTNRRLDCNIVLHYSGRKKGGRLWNPRWASGRAEASVTTPSSPPVCRRRSRNRETLF